MSTQTHRVVSARQSTPTPRNTAPNRENGFALESGRNTRGRGLELGMKSLEDQAKEKPGRRADSCQCPKDAHSLRQCESLPGVSIRLVFAVLSSIRLRLKQNGNFYASTQLTLLLRCCRCTWSPHQTSLSQMHPEERDLALPLTYSTANSYILDRYHDPNRRGSNKGSSDRIDWDESVARRSVRQHEAGSQQTRLASYL